MIATFLVVLTTVGPATFGDEDAAALEEARRRFLASRDAAALAQALEGTRAEDPDAVTDALLAALAADPRARLGEGSGRGYRALPEVVGALRRLDLSAATDAAARLGTGAPARLDVWISALLAARRGDDGTARSLLLGVGAREATEGRAAFRLALFGAALPDDDRLLLAGVARGALLDAVEAGRLDAASSLGREAAILDRSVGGDSLCLATRALRRAGRLEDAGRLLVWSRNHLARRDTDLCLERALVAWQSNRPQEARSTAQGLLVSPGDRYLAEALARAGACCDVVDVERGAVHVRAERAASHVLARMATALGVRTEPAEVEAEARADGRQAWEAAFAVRFLERRGLSVLAAAGHATSGERALEAGVPFLLYRIVPRDGAFVDSPMLVRGRDPATGLWIADEPDLRQQDVLPRDAPLKGRVLVALPRSRAAEVSSWATAQDRSLGDLLVETLDMADRGAPGEAASRLASVGARFAGLPAFDLYLGFLLYRRYAATREGPRVDQDIRALIEARPLLERSLSRTPHHAFEHFAVGQADLQAGDRLAAIARFDAAQGAAPRSAWIARHRFAVLLQGHGEKAMEAMDLARRLDPLDTESLFYRGATRRLLGHTAEARGDLLRALERRPESLDIGLELVALEIESGRPRRALALVDQLERRSPDLATEPRLVDLRRVAEGPLVNSARTVEELRGFLRSPLPETRRRAAFALARLETDAAERLLRTLLADPDEAVRVTALRVYMRPGLRTRVEADQVLGRKIVALLRRDESSVVRGAAAGLLSLVDRPWAARELAGTLVGDTRDPSSYPRAEAATALVRHDGRVARTALVAALQDDALDVRRAAIEALFRLASTYRGYDPEADPLKRAEAARRWVPWVEEGQG